LTDFVSEVQRSLGYFTNTHRDVAIQYMVGLGNAFRLPGLQRFLSEKLQLEVKKADKFHRLTGPGVVDAQLFTENILSFGVAYGLALQGLKKARLLTNLLPPEIRVERLIKAKKPWAAASAAVLLLSIAALAFGFGRQYAAYADKPGTPIEAAIKKGKTVTDRITGASAQFAAAKADAVKEQQNIEGIVAGAKEQRNWLELMKFIEEAVPRPESVLNPRSLPASAARYLEGAKDAYEHEFAAWQKGNGSPASAADNLPDGLDRLIQFNIESVQARYSGKLSDYWAKLPDEIKNPQKPYVYPPSDLNTPPPQTGGWVVELRGYTFHQEQKPFIIDVLMQSLVAKAAEKGDWGVPLSPAQTSPGPATGGAGQPQPPARRVSHIVLYSTSKGLPANVPFDKIGESKLAAVVKNPKGGEQSNQGGGLGGVPGVPGGGGGLGQPMGTGGGGVMPMGGTGQGGDKEDWKPLGSDTLTAQIAKPATGNEPPPRYEFRTEFVVFFIWQEPTPTDEIFLKSKGGAGGLPGGPGR
jgi:hypothetical protein